MFAVMQTANTGQPTVPHCFCGTFVCFFSVKALRQEPWVRPDLFLLVLSGYMRRPESAHFSNHPHSLLEYFTLTGLEQTACIISRTNDLCSF